MFFKIGVLKNFATFTGNHLCWSLFFLIKLQTFQRPFFNKVANRTPLVAASDAGAKNACNDDPNDPSQNKISDNLFKKY